MEDTTPLPAVSGLAPLVGTWRLILWGGSFLPDPQERVDAGVARFEWVEGGAVLAMHHDRDESGSPAARMIFGRDQDEEDYSVLYSDTRGVSRIYRMSFTTQEWRMWRDNPSFAQRFEASYSKDGSRMTGHWEKSIDRGAWEHDFNLEYSRVR